MTGHLVPTRIVNKNGILTTVHKAPKKSSREKQGIPLPAAPVDPETEALMERLGAVLLDAFRPVPDGIRRNDIEHKFRSLPKDTQQRIIEAASAHQGEKYFDRMIISLLHMGRSPETINDVVHVYRHTNDWTSLVMNSEWSEHGFDVDYGIISKFDWARTYNSMVRGFAFRVEDGDTTPLLEHDEKTQAQVIALIDIIGYLAEADYKFSQMLHLTDDKKELVIGDAAFAQLIVDHAERYSDVMTVMDERGTTDAGLIRSILESDAQPLRDGQL